MIFETKALKYQSVSFAKSQTEPLFSGLDLRIEPGVRLGILGPSGAGKSTLLRLLVGLDTPLSGEVRYQETAVNRKVPSVSRLLSQEMGVCVQKGGLFDFMTAAENVSFPMEELEKTTEDERQRRVEEALKSVGLWESKDKQVYELSGGMQKRLALSRAIVLRPKVLVLDEPTAGLDPITSREIADLILKVAENKTLVFVSSDIDVAYWLGTHFIFLDQGKIIQQGTREAIWNSEHPVLKRFVGKE